MGKLPANILNTARIGKHSDGGGLTLLIKSRDKGEQPKGSWIYRYTFQGKRYEMGLGSIQRLSLKNARDEVRRYNDMATDRRSPVNPIEERDRLAEAARSLRSMPTLNDIAPIAFEAIKGTLKGEGKAGRWYSPLELHVLPKLGKLPVNAIHQRDIEKALKPIWRTKAPTATKALNRLSIVMRHAAALGYSVDLNAIPNAKQILGHSGHTVAHHPAMTWKELSAFYQTLDPANTVQRALMLYILAGGGMRLLPLRLATVDQFADGVWTISGDKLKGRAGKVSDFRVPLTDKMQELVTVSIEQNIGGLLFPSPMAKAGSPKAISDQAIENVMRKAEVGLGWEQPYRPHGIRSTFRSWAAEVNPSLFAVAEAALAHNVGGVVERSYQRNDFLQKRMLLLENWANHLSIGSGKSTRNVVQFSS